MDPEPMNIYLTYAFAYCFEVDIRIRRHTNKRGREQTQINQSRLSLDLHTLFTLSKIIMWITITIYFDCRLFSISSLFMLSMNKCKV